MKSDNFIFCVCYFIRRNQEAKKMGRRKVDLNEEEAISEEVRNFPCLYNKTLKEYKDKRASIPYFSRFLNISCTHTFRFFFFFFERIKTTANSMRSSSSSLSMIECKKNTFCNIYIFISQSDRTKNNGSILVDTRKR